jgi:hypothetical protein
VAAQNPAAYRPELALTLTNLYVLYIDTHRFGEAEAAAKEAVAIERELASQNPAAYRPDLALTLNRAKFDLLRARFGDDAYQPGKSLRSDAPFR